MAETVNEELFDLGIRHQVNLLRLSNAAAGEVELLAANIAKDLQAQLQKATAGSFTAARLTAQLKAVREIMSDAFVQYSKTTTEKLADLAEYEAQWQAASLKDTLPIKWDIVTPSKNQLMAAVQARPFEGRLLKEWFTGLEQAAFERVQGAIRTGFVEGETIDQMITRLIGTKAANYKDGVVDISRRSAEAVVRTAVNHTAQTAREFTYLENADIIKGVRWVATLDSRTTLICASRDGKVYEMGKGPRPPAHINCRSTTVPVTKSWEELGLPFDELDAGTRASMDGQVPAETTYSEWLKGQPASVQDEVLGKTKAQLFRDGGVTLDKFVNDAGVEKTVDQLRADEAAAFKKAQIEPPQKPAPKTKPKPAPVTPWQPAPGQSIDPADYATIGGTSQALQGQTPDLTGKYYDTSRLMLSTDGSLVTWRPGQAVSPGSRFSEQETKGIFAYTAGNYKEINGALRGDKKYPMTPAIREQVNSIKSAFNKVGGLPEQSLLYRAAGSASMAKALDRLKSGEVFSDPGFLSTSADRNGINGFLASAPSLNNARIMRIMTPEGAKVIPAELLSASAQRGEAEFILDGGAKLRFVGRTDTDEKMFAGASSPKVSYYDFVYEPDADRIEVRKPAAVSTNIADYANLGKAGSKGGTGAYEAMARQVLTTNNTDLEYGEFKSGPPPAGSRLGETELKALQRYTGSAYSDINGSLRGQTGYGFSDREKAETLKRYMPPLNAAYEKVEALPQNTLLFRGTSDEFTAKLMDNLKPGDFFDDPGFRSATTDSDFAVRWSSAYLTIPDAPGRVARVMTPAGAKVIPVDTFSANKGESEMLVQAGSRWRFVGLGEIEFQRSTTGGAPQKIKTYDFIYDPADQVAPTP